MSKLPAAPARPRSGRVRVATVAVVALCALAVPAVIALAGPAPAAEQRGLDRSAPSRLAPASRLVPAARASTELMGPVAALISGGIQRTLAVTASAAAGASAAVPPPPPEFHCPVPGSEFVDSWGAPRSGGRKHKGVDMMASHGAPILAPMAGQVRHSRSELGGLGFYLTDVEGNEVYGGHLQKLGPQGWVESGTQLGTVGTTGNASSPHLHLSVKLTGKGSVNPYPIVAVWCGLIDPPSSP